MIWDKVFNRFGLKTWYDKIHWIYRDDSPEIQRCYEELYVDECNRIIANYLQEVV